MRAALSLLPLLLLASCSQYTELSARFIDGRLAFVAKDGRTVDCVQYLSVIDVATGATMWELGSAATGDCQSSLPVFYGQGGVKTPLVPERRYEVGGSASGGNSMSGRFVISRRTGWSVEDKVMGRAA